MGQSGVDIAHYARPRDCDSGLFVLNLFQSDVNVITVTLLIMRFEDIKQDGSAVDEVNTEGDSNHVTECSYDDESSTVYWMFWVYLTNLAVAIIISYIMQLQCHLTWTHSK